MLDLPPDVAQLLRPLGHRPEFLPAFQDALKKSAQASIDAFLERRPEWRDLGKALIAALILEREREPHFYGNDDHWYQLLIDKIDDPFDSIDFGNVTIVTFNYDRSLKQFLFQSLCNRHNKSCEVVARLLRGLRIIHVYGSLGPLDWEEPGGRKYFPDLQVDDVRRAASGIKVIAEGRDDSAEFEQAKTAIQQGSRVFFLGMAYHPDNMRRLGLPVERIAQRELSGSAFDLTGAERNFVVEKYHFSHLGGETERSRLFLRNNPYFLRLKS